MHLLPVLVWSSLRAPTRIMWSTWMRLSAVNTPLLHTVKEKEKKWTVACFLCSVADVCLYESGRRHFDHFNDLKLVRIIDWI